MSTIDLTLSLHTIDGDDAMRLIQKHRRALFLGNRTAELRDLSKLEDQIIGELIAKNRHYVKDNVDSLVSVLKISNPPKKKHDLPEKKTKHSRVLTPEKFDKVKESIKKLLKDNFRFTNAEECTSAKRSQKYYTSKTEILDVIERVPEVKKLMPAKYKSLNKEDLCKSIFEIKN